MFVFNIIMFFFICLWGTKFFLRLGGSKLLGRIGIKWGIALNEIGYCENTSVSFRELLVSVSQETKSFL